MLRCQRHLFAIERDVAYLNAASYAPLPLAVQTAGEKGVAEKVKPWERSAQAAHRNGGGGAHASGAPHRRER